MKIIDKTPLLDEKGKLGMTQRLQGMLQFGFNWPNELQAQQAIITFFDRQLEKGYTLIRNYTLGQSGIMVPIILLGPSGIYVIHIAQERGRYEINGEKWNIAAGEGYKPAPVNLVQHTMRMAKAVRQWIERQGVKVPVNIEPVIIAGDPGLHIESVNPAIKALRIDGIKSFVSNLAAGRPVLSTENVFELSERIVNPRPPKKPVHAPAPAASLPHEDPFYPPQQEQEVSRARAIFDASQQAKPFDPADFEFAMEDEASMEIPPDSSGMDVSQESTAAQSKPQRKRIMGMTPGQLTFIVILAVVALCVFGVLAYLLLL